MMEVVMAVRNLVMMLEINADGCGGCDDEESDDAGSDADGCVNDEILSGQMMTYRRDTR